MGEIVCSHKLKFILHESKSEVVDNFSCLFLHLRCMGVKQPCSVKSGDSLYIYIHDILNHFAFLKEITLELPSCNIYLRLGVLAAPSRCQQQ